MNSIVFFPSCGPSAIQALALTKDAATSMLKAAPLAHIYAPLSDQL